MCTVIGNNASANSDIHYRGILQHQSATHDQMFSIPATSTVYAGLQSLHDLEATYEGNGLRIKGGNYWVVDHQHTAYAQTSRIQEFSYENNWKDIDWSAGKRVHAWGVGYGFRPLDLIQRERRLELTPHALDGIPSVTLETFGPSDVYGLVWFNRATVSVRSFTSSANEFVVRYTKHAANRDIYALAHATERKNFSLGAGYTALFGERWELHGSALATNNTERWLRAADAPLLATRDPFTVRRDTPVAQYALGGVMTLDSGINLIAEAWYDGEAYSAAEWDTLQTIVKTQRTLFGQGPSTTVIDGNLLWNARALQAPNLRQYNLFARLSYSDPQVSPACDLLFTPEDRGIVAGLNVDYTFNRYTKGSLSMRYFGGASDSIYAQLPSRFIVLAGIETTLRMK
ncbi:MAG: hypothetical protein OEW08_00255 [Gammaproteobacteria bacterium]|nr:hypothetical protein [Gammaproteobacteria bacterium]